jgi:glyoxylase-like metal-dependent hydrolase (beta-lactamase superfamily II)
MARSVFAFLLFLAANVIATPFTYERVKVAEGVYAFIEGPTVGVVSGNSTVIVGDEAVAVVDTGAHPDLVRRMIAEIRALTPKPVRYIVNTHWHNDHVAGNAIYAEEFPAATLVAHAFTAQLLETVVRPFYGRCDAYRSKQARQIRESQPGSRLADEADALVAECRDLRHKPVDLAFDDHVTLNLGNREARVMFLGRANTAGDAIVHVPDARVVAAGDILVYPIPYAFQSYIGEWVGALRAIESMDVAAIVPGHGPVMRDKEYVRLVADAMQSVDSQVRAIYKPGMALADVRKAMDLRDLRARFSKGNTELEQGFDGMVAGAAVARTYQAIRNELKPEGLLGE